MKDSNIDNKQVPSDRPWRKDASPVNKPPTTPGYPEAPFNRDDWMKSSKPMEEECSTPVVGDVIRTKKLEGKVTKVEDGYVYFTTSDGRNMRNTIQNATVIEKLVDQDEEVFEDEELNEISNEVLTRYKTAAAADARAADKAGNTERGNKRFSGVVKATNKQFDNDAKARASKKNEALKFSPGSFPDVDHMNGSVIKDYDFNRNATEKKTFSNYDEWKSYADHINGLLHDDNAEIISDRHSETYGIEGEKIFAAWNVNKGFGYVSSSTNEGSMGGINRSAPANDVSYEKVLDEVANKWEQEQLDELSVSTLQSYKDKAGSSEVARKSPLRKVVKHIQGAKQAGDKIATKTGDRTDPARRQGPNRGAFEESILSSLLTIDEANDPTSFTSILNKQHQDAPVVKKKTVDIPYHGWLIRYRPASTEGESVNWMILDKKFNEKHRGSSMSDKDAVRDAEDWIKSGGGTQQTSSKNVAVDFNVNFTKEFAPDGGDLYISFGKDGVAPSITISTEPTAGAKKTHARNQKDKITATTTKLLMVALSAKESNALGLQPNGRYILGDKVPVNDTTAKFSVIFQGIVQHSGDLVRLGKPGFTVAHSREVDEDCWKGYTQYGMKDKGGKQVPNCVPKTDEAYEGPWQGDSVKQAKAPKSTTRGTGDIRLTDLVQDSIKTHGVKWAFEYYVKKHGMAPREFQIFAGLTPKGKEVPRVKDEWTDPSRTRRPEKKGWWAKLRGKLPFEE